MQLERLMEQAQFGQVGEMSGVAQTPVGGGGAVWQFQSRQGWAHGVAHQAGVHTV